MPEALATSVPTEIDARRDAREARAAAGRALNWLDPSRGELDLRNALANAEHAFYRASDLVANLKLMIDAADG